MAFTTRDGKTQTQLSEINMIPFIDVMLVLLIIFMVTAPVVQSGIEVDVPRTEFVQELVEERLVVIIDREELLYLQNDPININDLGAAIEALQPDPTLRNVYLQADTAVPWGTMATVMDRLTQFGIGIVAVTQPLGDAAQ